MFADLLRRLTAPEPERLSDPDARLALAALLVRLARADGVRDHEENTLMRLAANLLGVSDRDSNFARLKVEGK